MRNLLARIAEEARAIEYIATGNPDDALTEELDAMVDGKLLDDFRAVGHRFAAD